MEVWGNTYSTNTKSIFILQKRAIRIINKATYREPSNQLFIKVKALKFKDLVDIKTAQIMYKAHQNILPNNIQILFQKKDNHYYFRGNCMFSQPPVRTDTKNHCVSVKGVKLWNGFKEELKYCETWNKFKYMFKTDIMITYSLHG